jgi:imidazolonepropionase
MPAWDLLLTNANLATMAAPEGYGAIERASLAIADGRIAFAGPQNALPEGEAVVTLDLAGKWVTPGLIDCHTHLVYGGNRSAEFEMRLAGASYVEIAASGGGIRSTVLATRAASEDALFANAATRLQALLAEGVTTVEVKSGYGLDRDAELRMLRVARRLGEAFPVSVRATYLGGHTVPAEFSGNPAGYVDLVCDLIGEVARDRLADAFDVCYDPIGFDREQSERMLAASRAAGLPVKLHTGQFASQGGGALAAAYRALSADHVEYLSEEDVVAMAAAGTVAVLLPGAFYFIRETQRPPVELLRRHGVPIAIGTDHNPGSSPLLSLTLAMNMGSILFGLMPPETLAGVTRNAARALGLIDSRGTLEAGKRADLAVWSVERPAELGYAIGPRSTVGVIRGGRIVRDAGAFGAPVGNPPRQFVI